MRAILALFIILTVATAAVATNLGPQPILDKPETAQTPPAPDPDVLRQGGDTIGDATVITGLPFSETGTTAGYIDDYDEVCPYTGSTSPDVVYSFTPEHEMLIAIDLEGSSYDTKVYVYDPDMNLVACNDDFYDDYTSFLGQVYITAGLTYSIVIDGYGSAFGEYELMVRDDDMQCVMDCPPGGEVEGEPPLVDGYDDQFNSGCGGIGVPIQPITQEIFCGRSGWFLGSDGSSMRDTDWFTVTIGDAGYLDVFGDAEWPTFLFELGPLDCADVAVIQQTTIGPCIEDGFTITGAPGQEVWLWIGSPYFENNGYMDDEYDYVLWITPAPVVTRADSWSAVKGLFD